MANDHTQKSALPPSAVLTTPPESSNRTAGAPAPSKLTAYVRAAVELAEAEAWLSGHELSIAVGVHNASCPQALESFIFGAGVELAGVIRDRALKMMRDRVTIAAKGAESEARELLALCHVRDGAACMGPQELKELVAGRARGLEHG